MKKADFILITIFTAGIAFILGVVIGNLNPKSHVNHNEIAYCKTACSPAALKNVYVDSVCECVTGAKIIPAPKVENGF